MIKDLQSVSLLDILPSNILEDEKVNAAARALDGELQKITAAVQEVLFLPYLDVLPEKVLDLLAWQWHVDFYEPIGLSLDKKRALIRQSIAWHRQKGTPAAVEGVVTAAFDKSWIEEWYEYGGEPYFFKVYTENATTNREEIDRMKRAIDSVKNVRSWLEKIEFIVHLESDYPEIWDELEKRLSAVLGLSDYVPYSGAKRRTYDGTYLYGGEPLLYDGRRQYNGEYKYTGNTETPIRYDSESGEMRLEINITGLKDTFSTFARYNGSQIFDGLGVYGERASPVDDGGGLTIAKIRRYNGKRRYDGGSRNLYDGSLSYDGAADCAGGNALKYSPEIYTDGISGAKSFRALTRRPPWSERHAEGGNIA